LSPIQPLSPVQLRRCSDVAQFEFSTTDDLPDLTSAIGQERPIGAIRFGVKMDRPGYNIFALGPVGVGKYTVASRAIAERAAAEPPPPDWCYVNNFDQPYRPRVLRLPTGMGREFRRDMDRLVEDMQTALSAAFESEEYQARRRALESEFQDRQQETLMALQEQAKERNLALLRTPAGLAFAPLKENNVLPPEEYEKMPEEEQQRIQADVEVMQEELQKILGKAPRWERELRNRLRELNREVAGIVLGDLHNELAAKYADQADVLAHLDAVRQDVNEHLADFLMAGESKHEAAATDGESQPAFMEQVSPLRRYQVNLLVDSADLTGAPVIYESNPTYLNLTGRVEQMAQMGALITDFMLIKPGMLHRANGGYLILDAMKVLLSPYAWEGLKRALQFGEIRIESALQMLSLTSTISLEPEAVPLDLKVVLMGDRMLYYLLSEADPDFNELFKVVADFADEAPRNDENLLSYAQLIATIARNDKLRPLARGAVCRVIDHAARLVSDAERLSVNIQAIVDLVQEADYWANEEGAATITAAHVQQAIDAQIFRLDRVARLMQDEVLRNTIHIDTSGAVIGQINGIVGAATGQFHLWPAVAHHRYGAHGPRGCGQHRARGQHERADPRQGCADPVELSQRALRHRPPPLPLRQHRLRAILRRRRGGQRLLHGTVRAALRHRRGADQADAGGDRLGRPAWPHPGHRRRQREDRGLLRPLPGARSDRRPGRADPGDQCQASHAAAGCGRRG
jgi:predicted ATP-dependent protease